ncbi:phosphoribosylformylglycinamidine synthase subunit PurS [Leptolyngbya sp. 15MV]|nr:phosphoribosylformylglycinamidine synthase subunit PurS [Leptolyngbya sp. 15MV]
MKAKVYVTLKPSVLDPQGKAIHHSVELLGFENISDITPEREVDETATAALRADRVKEAGMFHRHGTRRDADAWWRAMSG